MTRAEIERAAEVVRGARSLVLACHVAPDGDALGSMLGFLHLCRANGVEAIASFSEPFVVAPHYEYLPGVDLLWKPADVPNRPDVMVTFDSGSLVRLGDLRGRAEAARELVVLDHHASNDRFGTVNVIDTEAAATAVVVRRLAAELGWALNRDAAICLYTGLVTDTGRFQYSNTTPEVFDLARELATFDLPIADISRKLFEEHRFDYIRLVGAALARAQLDRDLGFVATWVTAFDLDGFGVTLDETEGLIDLVRRATEADVACVCKEAHDGVRVSLRSLPGSNVDVEVIASHLGGGGHRYAAGFTAPYPVTGVLDAIRDEIRRQKQ